VGALGTDGRFYFSSALPAQMSEAERTWRWVKNTTDQSVLENFIKEFGGTPFGEEAKARLTELKQQQVAIATPPPAARPTAPAKEPLLPGLIDKTLEVVLPRDRPTPARCDGVETLVGNERRCLRPGAGKRDWFRDCPGCPEMVVVPAGKFNMGSPVGEPDRGNDEMQHEVTIGKPFAVGRFAVTRGEFAFFVKDTGHLTARDNCYAYVGRGTKALGSWRSPGFEQDERHPVVCVTWNDGKAFAQWLAKKTGKRYRLLSEAEREYVARAGTTTPYWWGASISTNQANYGETHMKTVVVDSFEANPWGLYNVHGNVSEWVEDCYDENYTGAPTDGSAWSTRDCRARAIRGGSWRDGPHGLRAASRPWSSTIAANYEGFRVARTLDP